MGRVLLVSALVAFCIFAAGGEKPQRIRISGRILLSGGDPSVPVDGLWVWPVPTVLASSVEEGPIYKFPDGISVWERPIPLDSMEFDLMLDAGPRVLRVGAIGYVGRSVLIDGFRNQASVLVSLEWVGVGTIRLRLLSPDGTPWSRKNFSALLGVRCAWPFLPAEERTYATSIQTDDEGWTLLRVRPGRYTVWVLGPPREGVEVVNGRAVDLEMRGCLNPCQ